MPDEEEVELGEDDLGLIGYSGEEIDLDAELAQEVIMALPQQFICSEECAGLCPVCGENQNQVECGCERPVFNSGLAALKGFKVKED